MKIGIDIQDIPRVKNIKPHHMERIFASSELEYITRKNSAPQTMAGLYAAKEAFFKALGTGVQHSKLTSVEIDHDKFGAPYYNLKNTEWVELKTVLSISHSKNTAVAVCLIQN